MRGGNLHTSRLAPTFYRLATTQPENWDALIKQRDGEETEAGVQMFIVPYKQEKATGEEKTEDGRIMQPWTARPGHEVIENFRVAAPDQDMKGEVRIVARRGKRATTVQLGMSEKRSWKQLKGKDGGFAAPEGMCCTTLSLYEPLMLTTPEDGLRITTIWPMLSDGSMVDGVVVCSLRRQR
jgi:hypothetical protein